MGSKRFRGVRLFTSSHDGSHTMLVAAVTPDCFRGLHSLQCLLVL